MGGDAPTPPLSLPLLLAAVAIGFFSLFPYNSLLSSATYFQHYYQYAAVKSASDVSELPTTNNEAFWKNASNWATVTMLVAMTIVQFFMITPFMLHRNVRIRIFAGGVILFISMLIMPVCAAGGGVSEVAAMTVLLLSSFLSGSGTSLLQSSCYGLFSTLPTIYVTAFAFGGGASGSFNSLLRIIIHYGLPTTFSGIKTGAVIFYCVGMVLLATACVLVVLLRYHPLLQQCCSSFAPNMSIWEDPPREHHPHTMPPTVDHSPTTLTICDSQPILAHSEPGFVQPESEDERFTESTTTQGQSTEGDDSSWSVMKRIWPMMLSGYLTFALSLVFFPRLGVKAMHKDYNPTTDTSATSSSSGWEPEEGMPLVVILMYNLGDFVGRLLPLKRSFWAPKPVLALITICRFVISITLLTLGLVEPKIINSTANPMVVFLFLGLTNGYILGNSIGYGCSDPSLKTESEHATAGTCMTFAMLLGCATGSVISLVVMVTVY